MTSGDIPGNTEPGTSEERRGFLKAILGTGFFGLAVSVLYPTWRFVFPPRNVRVAEQAVRAGSVDEFPHNSGLITEPDEAA